MGLSHSGTWWRGWTWTPSQGICLGPARAKDRGKLVDGAGMPGAGLTVMSAGQARSDRLALKPYWGKPDVRNFRGGDGNVGIIRSPVRAIALPDLTVPNWNCGNGLNKLGEVESRPQAVAPPVR